MKFLNNYFSHKLKISKNMRTNLKFKKKFKKQNI